MNFSDRRCPLKKLHYQLLNQQMMNLIENIIGISSSLTFCHGHCVLYSYSSHVLLSMLAIDHKDLHLQANQIEQNKYLWSPVFIQAYKTGQKISSVATQHPVEFWSFLPSCVPSHLLSFTLSVS